MILYAIAAKLKQRSKTDFAGRHYEATLIVQAVSWYTATRKEPGFGFSRGDLDDSLSGWQA